MKAIFLFLILLHLSDRAILYVVNSLILLTSQVGATVFCYIPQLYLLQSLFESI